MLPLARLLRSLAGQRCLAVAIATEGHVHAASVAPMESTNNTTGPSMLAAVATAGVAVATPASLAAQTDTTGSIDSTAAGSATHGTCSGPTTAQAGSDAALATALRLERLAASAIESLRIVEKPLPRRAEWIVH